MQRGSRKITQELQLRPANGRRSGAAAELGRPTCRSAVVFTPLLRAVLKDRWATARLNKQGRRGSVQRRRRSYIGATTQSDVDFAPADTKTRSEPERPRLSAFTNDGVDSK